MPLSWFFPLAFPSILFPPSLPPFSLTLPPSTLLPSPSLFPPSLLLSLSPGYGIRLERPSGPREEPHHWKSISLPAPIHVA